ncbi:hypothetical protein GCM10009560_56850 [Nonomuraea longicatena]|uniref:Uncharacterized protein n=1 Tax=Nonomuraea longicatena TaxID=83682 RepID=A0ABN1QJ61_9ACTN
MCVCPGAREKERSHPTGRIEDGPPVRHSEAHHQLRDIGTRHRELPGVGLQIALTQEVVRRGGAVLVGPLDDHLRQRGFQQALPGPDSVPQPRTRTDRGPHRTDTHAGDHTGSSCGEQHVNGRLGRRSPCERYGDDRRPRRACLAN